MDLKWRQRKPFEGVQSEVPAWFVGSERDVDLEGFHGDDPLSLMRGDFSQSSRCANAAQGWPHDARWRRRRR